MKRLLLSELRAWKGNPARKPLILTGARQVGKTWLLKKFGEGDFGNMAYLDFERDERLGAVFDETLDQKVVIDKTGARVYDPEKVMAVWRDYPSPAGERAEEVPIQGHSKRGEGAGLRIRHPMARGRRDSDRGAARHGSAAAVELPRGLQRLQAVRARRGASVSTFSATSKSND